jgi:uncharacterized protein (TIGR00725 family)
MPRSVTVAVTGPGGDVADDLLELAFEVGALLARDGALVATGGLGGVMAAATRGAAEAGGHPIGLLPGLDPAAGNEHLTVPLATGLGELRNALLVNIADGLISVGGSWGTLSEIALAMRTGKPVVSLRGWKIRDVAGQAIPLPEADSAAQAVALLRTALHR